MERIKRKRMRSERGKKREQENVEVNCKRTLICVNKIVYNGDFLSKINYLRSRKKKIDDTKEIKFMFGCSEC